MYDIRAFFLFFFISLWGQTLAGKVFGTSGKWDMRNIQSKAELHKDL